MKQKGGLSLLKYEAKQFGDYQWVVFGAPYLFLLTASEPVSDACCVLQGWSVSFTQNRTAPVFLLFCFSTSDHLKLSNSQQKSWSAKHFRLILTLADSDALIALHRCILYRSISLQNSFLAGRHLICGHMRGSRVHSIDSLYRYHHFSGYCITLALPLTTWYLAVKLMITQLIEIKVSKPRSLESDQRRIISVMHSKKTAGSGWHQHERGFTKVLLLCIFSKWSNVTDAYRCFSKFLWCSCALPILVTPNTFLWKK